MPSPRQQRQAPVRPSKHAPTASAEAGTRERLLTTGLELAGRNGLKAVSVRAVAAAAEVNLGSFVYHFGTRDAFVYELVDRWYAPLMAGLQCRRRSKSEPPCRPNIEPGVEADFEMVGCG